jgi:heme oxygenase
MAPADKLGRFPHPMNRSIDTAREADAGRAAAATASRHEALDSGLPIGAPDATLPTTPPPGLLRDLAGPLQAWLGGFADGPQFDHAPRLALIDADLAEPSLASPYLPSPRTRPRRLAGRGQPRLPLGRAYVIEGSQLGGAVLYKRLRERWRRIRCAT